MDLRSELQSLLGASYTIERELAGAGMSRVFVAEETRLERKIALKVLPPEIASGISTERFAREIRLLAKLQHPHIVPILTAGEAGGILYYTMPMIAGESLRERLSRVGHLKVSEAAQITSQVADALEFAHSQGVLHRDIKPENILLFGGHALVLDFGIAKAIDASKTSEAALRTQDGMALGTPMYMSPEQALGDALDARSDVYSLAIVLFEMLTGAPPFSGPNPTVIIARRFVDTPLLVSTVRSDIPEYISRAIARATALAPDDRFESVLEFATALLQPTDLVQGSPESGQRRPERPERSIAVLPFINIGGDVESEYFCDGMTEEIINAIAHLPGVRVAARTSSFSFKGKDIDIARVGAKLNVATVMEGSVRRAGGRIRVTTQLINVADGYQLWSQRYDRNVEDVFSIQDDIARAIVEHLRIALVGSADQVLVHPGTDDVEAYDLYLRGRHFWARRGAGLATAIEYFNRAIEADPEFAAPYAGLADSYTLMAVNGYMSSRDAFERARMAAYRALTLNPRAAESHTAVGLFELWMGWDFTIAGRELHRAIEANPSWAVPVFWIGQLALCRGDEKEAQVAADRARRLEPLSPLTMFLAAAMYVWTGSFVDAELIAHRAVELDPSFPMGYLAEGWVHHHYGRYDEATTTLQHFVDLCGRSPLSLTALGSVLSEAGRFDEARAILGELESRRADAWFLGQLYWKLGQENQAFQLFERAAQDRHPHFFVLARVPGLERLIADPRWNSLLRKCGLDEVARGFEASQRTPGERERSFGAGAPSP